MPKTLSRSSKRGDSPLPPGIHACWEPNSPCQVSTPCLAWVFLLETLQGHIFLNSCCSCFVGLDCKVLTSCLSVSLAIISLWSMRDSSSTSSSD